MRKVEREDQSGDRVSLALPTSHTDGAVQTQPPPMPRAHRADGGWFEVVLLLSTLSTSGFFFSGGIHISESITVNPH